jgi:hypothetical protein
MPLPLCATKALPRADSSTDGVRVADAPNAVPSPRKTVSAVPSTSR